MAREGVIAEIVIRLTSFYSEISADELKIKILILNKDLKAVKIRVRIK